MRPIYSHSLILLVPLALLLSPSRTALACGDEEEVQVTVVSILATDKDNTVDKKLKELAARIQKERPQLKLTGFRIDRQTKATLVVKQTQHEFEFIDKQTAVVSVCQGPDANNKVQLKVKLKCGSGMCYTTCCGKFMPICTCYKTAKGESLLIAVMVEPCKGK
jgi:hypothetical protein